MIETGKGGERGWAGSDHATTLREGKEGGEGATQTEYLRALTVQPGCSGI